MGAKTVKVVVLCDRDVVARALELSGFEPVAGAEAAMRAALAEAGVARRDVSQVVATGAGREDAPDKDRTLDEVGAAARAAIHLFPDVRTVVDVGAEDGRALRCDEKGKVVDFVVNEKCAAGAGAFTESVARALEVGIEELGPLALESTETIPMNAQCVVFAESELVSMIHRNVSKPDMARAAHDAIASRIISMVGKVGCKPAIALVGGVARNVGFRDALERGLKIADLRVPDDPEYCAALGAALSAADEA